MKLPAVVHVVPLPDVESVHVVPACHSQVQALPVAAGLSSFWCWTPLVVTPAKAQARAVVVDLEAQPVVGVLLHEDALQLVALRGHRLELGLGGEVGVGRRAHARRRAVGVPRLAGGAARHRQLEAGVARPGAGHRHRAVAGRVGHRPGAPRSCG